MSKTKTEERNGCVTVLSAVALLVILIAAVIIALIIAGELNIVATPVHVAMLMSL